MNLADRLLVAIQETWTHHSHIVEKKLILSPAWYFLSLTKTSDVGKTSEVFQLNFRLSNIELLLIVLKCTQ